MKVFFICRAGADCGFCLANAVRQLFNFYKARRRWRRFVFLHGALLGSLRPDQAARKRARRGMDQVSARGGMNGPRSAAGEGSVRLEGLVKCQPTWAPCGIERSVSRAKKHPTRTMKARSTTATSPATAPNGSTNPTTTGAKAMKKTRPKMNSPAAIAHGNKARLTTASRLFFSREEIGTVIHYSLVFAQPKRQAPGREAWDKFGTHRGRICSKPTCIRR